MSLIKCKECGAQISSKATVCPKCGISFNSSKGCGSTIALLIYIILLGIILPIYLIQYLFDDEKNSPDKTEISKNYTPIVESQKTTQSLVSVSQWLYSHSDDAMAKNAVHQAYVSSSNTVNLSFPYEGNQHGTLLLRTHPRYGKDVIFSIEKGQILCHSYEDCIVLVRFDDNKAVNFSAASAADNSTETIFIRNYKRFVEKMLKSKKVRIEVNIYQQGAPIFEFDVSGFDKDRYKLKN